MNKFKLSALAVCALGLASEASAVERTPTKSFDIPKISKSVTDSVRTVVPAEGEPVNESTVPPFAQETDDIVPQIIVQQSPTDEGTVAPLSEDDFARRRRPDDVIPDNIGAPKVVGAEEKPQCSGDQRHEVASKDWNRSNGRRINGPITINEAKLYCGNTRIKIGAIQPIDTDRDHGEDPETYAYVNQAFPFGSDFGVDAEVGLRQITSSNRYIESGPLYIPSVEVTPWYRPDDKTTLFAWAGWYDYIERGNLYSVGVGAQREFDPILGGGRPGLWGYAAYDFGLSHDTLTANVGGNLTWRLPVLDSRLTVAGDIYFDKDEPTNPNIVFGPEVGIPIAKNAEVYGYVDAKTSLESGWKPGVVGGFGIRLNW